MSLLETLGNVCVLGFGKTGVSVCTYLLQQPEGRVSSVTLVGGADATVGEKIQELADLGVQVQCGSDQVKGTFDLTIASPGIPDTSELFLSAKAASKQIMGEPEFAYQESPSQWIGITGTNGKTTTTSLTTSILQYAGLDASAVGNIGLTITDQLAERKPKSWFVAELSSFQLATTQKLHPHVAMLLNITPDHLEWHGSLEAYAAAKEKIFANLDANDLAIVSDLDEFCQDVSSRLEARGIAVCHLAQTDPGTQNAAFVRNGALVVRLSGKEMELVAADALHIRGAHNALNALAAAACGLFLGLDIVSIRHALLDFMPLEHRIEPVDTVNGVLYVNDSKATNTDSVEKSLTSFPGKDVILLLGGHDKGTELDEFAQKVSATCAYAICFGEAGPRFAEALRRVSGSHAEVVEEPHMHEAFDRAVELARPGSVVLLSPACSSFDEFTGMAQRGRVFKQLVADLAQKESGR